MRAVYRWIHMLFFVPQRIGWVYFKYGINFYIWSGEINNEQDLENIQPYKSKCTFWCQNDFGK